MQKRGPPRNSPLATRPPTLLADGNLHQEFALALYTTVPEMGQEGDNLRTRATGPGRDIRLLFPHIVSGEQ